MDLSEVHERIVNTLRSTIRYLASGYPMDESGGELEQVSALFEGLAICHLLESLNAEKFRENLVRSGQARCYYLERSKAQGNTASKYLAISRSDGFLDTLVSGELNAARSIARLSQRQWNRDWEYEDDFCFHLFLHQVLLQSPASETGATLTRFEAALEGATSARLDTLKAIEAKSLTEFEAGLSLLLEQEQDGIDARRSSVVDSKFLFWPRSFVSIEGLALLRAAELAGFSIDRSFPMCPREALLPVGESNYRDFFAELAGLLVG